MNKQHIIFDTEIIGWDKPVFLVCTKNVETGETNAFWHHKRGDLRRFLTLFDDPQYTWISFNGIRFDAPLIAAWINGRPVETIKAMCTAIIEQKMQPWEAYRLAGMDGLKFDHIDIIEVAPGVMVSLKTYAGRMHYATMVDLPFHYNDDLTPKQCKILEAYCRNDLGVTEALFNQLRVEIELRVKLGATYGLDLRSKSDAQAAEAILKKEAKLGKATGLRPRVVEYRLPAIVKTRNKLLKDLINSLESEQFTIDQQGSPILPAWLTSPITLHGGLYKVGIGGLHSQHDKQLYAEANEANDEYEISDIDAGSYYPSLILKCGYVPHLSGKGDAFIKAYRAIYDQRMAAKHAGMKQVAHSLKIALNGTYGKLGNIYSAFYAPELMLAVCLTGQLNLLCLIDEMGKKGIEVISANTDGIMLRYKKTLRDEVFRIVAANSKRTGFEYEETRYSKVGMKDVNNYLAIKTNGEVKAKGLYADTGLQKNPTALVCAHAATAFIKDGIKPETFIKKVKTIEPFLSIRGVTGGGVQHTRLVEVDDWVCVQNVGTKDNLWMRQKWLDEGRSPDDQGGGGAIRRKSRPAPVLVGVGGKPFGRVARWYMTTATLPPLQYVSSGKKVPLTDGARLCLTLPDQLPADLDRQWYINETYSILNDLGVTV